jgi:hypothetical protein
MIITVSVEFNIGEVLYLKTDKEQAPRILIGYQIYGNVVMYEVICINLISTHYTFELSRTKDVILTSTN